jgi:hypothetical protein
MTCINVMLRCLPLLTCVAFAANAWSASPTPPPTATPTPGSSYNIYANFNSLPTSPLTTAQLKTVFVDPNVMNVANLDKSGKHIAVVSSGCKSTRCIQYYYPKGSVGEDYPDGSISSFDVQMKGTGTVVCEFDWMFENGFDIGEQGGKLPMSIRFGAHYDATATSILGPNAVGLRVMWAIANKRRPIPGWRTYIGSNKTGNHWKTDVVSRYNITIGAWHHIKEQLSVSKGTFQTWIDGQSLESGNLQSCCNISVISGTPIHFHFDSFFGGAGTAAQAKWDSWSLMDNVHIQGY